jgi:hypothetical protein
MEIDRSKAKGKLLFWDIETSLIEVYTHQLGQQYVDQRAIKKDKQIICISYKAEGWKKPRTLKWDNGDDTQLLKDFSEIAQQYELLVAQNGDQFDIKVLKGRLWARGLDPLTNIRTLDTLKMSKQNLKLTSHKLDYKLNSLGLGGKIPTSFGLWVRVQNGDKQALREMVEYCEGDVEGLQAVFWSLLPYVDKLPTSLGVLVTSDRDSCSKCSGKPIKWGTRAYATGIKQRWRCSPCGHTWDDTRLKSNADRKESYNEGY